MSRIKRNRHTNEPPIFEPIFSMALIASLVVGVILIFIIGMTS